MRLVDLGQAAVDDLLVELFLLLEPEHLAGFFIQHPGDTVEGGIMEIGVKGGDGFDRHVEGLAERQPGHQPAERIVAAVDRDDNLAAVHRQSVLDDQHVGIPDTPDDAFRIAADHAVLHRADAEGAHNDEVVRVRIDILDKYLQVPSFEGPALDRQVGLGAFLVDVVQVRIRNDLKAAGDQRVMDLPLPLELLLVMVLFGRPASICLKRLSCILAA